jgi:hypothetical protein
VEVSSFWSEMRTYPSNKMTRHHFPESFIEFRAVLVKNHGVSIPVQLLETESTVVLPLNFLNGALQHAPDLVYVLFIHVILLKNASIYVFSEARNAQQGVKSEKNARKTKCLPENENSDLPERHESSSCFRCCVQSLPQQAVRWQAYSIEKRLLRSDHDEMKRLEVAIRRKMANSGRRRETSSLFPSRPSFLPSFLSDRNFRRTFH